jgi:predicted RNase H-like HicB family nuclease
MNDYHINIFYSPDDEAYIADIPDFEMCSAHGSTPQEALAEVLIARDAILEEMKARGQQPPSPRYRPAIYQVG